MFSLPIVVYTLCISLYHIRREISQYIYKSSCDVCYLVCVIMIYSLTPSMWFYLCWETEDGLLCYTYTYNVLIIF